MLDIDSSADSRMLTDLAIKEILRSDSRKSRGNTRVRADRKEFKKRYNLPNVENLH